MVIPIGSRWSTTPLRHAPARGEQAKEQDASPRDLALAQARATAGAAIEERLRGLGASNPAGGAKTILDALVEVQTPVEVMGALLEVGERRLERQQELSHIPNPTGYLIGIMRNLAVEAWLRGRNLAQIQAEDEEKHAQALRSAAHAGNKLLSDEGTAAPLEESTPEAPQVAGKEESETVAPPEALGWADVDSRAPPTPEAVEGNQQEVAWTSAQGREREEAAAQPPRRDGRARQIWQSTLERIQPKISQAMFNTWFAGTSGQTFDGQTLTVAVRTTFNRSHLETRFHDLVRSILYDLVGPDAEVCFEVEHREEP